MSSAIKGVLLDMDGTLVDSNDAHAHAWVRALAEAGHVVEYERVRGLIGMGGDQLLPAVCGVEADSVQGKQISERRGEIFTKHYLPTLKPFPHVRELIQHMLDHGLKLVMASSATEAELQALLEVANISDLITRQTSADDAEASKPEPDIIHAALDEIGLTADQVIMLGDTPYDIQAAQKASVGTIALRSGGWNDADLADAIAIYADCADLLAHYDQSPFGA